MSHADLYRRQRRPMHRFTVDYRRDEPSRRSLVNKGFFVHGVPRLIPLCRLLGHRPVVDGTKGLRGQPGRRWVCCDRCGVRPEPQGSLDSDLVVGQPYVSGHSDDGVVLGDLQPCPPGRLPGPWPDRPEGALGGQVVIGGGMSGPSVQLKVGNAGSEHTLAAHLTLGRLGGLYLHTERHGSWLQRRLNPTGYDSRVIGASLHDGRLSWQVWAKRDHFSRSDPWWVQGSLVLDPRDRLLGARRYSYADEGEPVTAAVRMPHGDDHQVTLRLRRQTCGRRKGRKRLSWTVDCDCPGGVPTKPGGRGRVTGLAVHVSDVSAREGGWPTEASAAAALRIAKDRARCGWTAPAEPAHLDGRGAS